MYEVAGQPDMCMILAARELVAADGVPGSLCSSAKGNSAKEPSALRSLMSKWYIAACTDDSARLCSAITSINSSSTLSP